MGGDGGGGDGGGDGDGGDGGGDGGGGDGGGGDGASNAMAVMVGLAESTVTPRVEESVAIGVALMVFAALSAAED